MGSSHIFSVSVSVTGCLGQLRLCSWTPFISIAMVPWTFRSNTEFTHCQGTERSCLRVDRKFKLFKGPMRCMWMFPKIVGFPPKSSILIGFSMIFTSILGETPLIFENTHVFPMRLGRWSIWKGSCNLTKVWSCLMEAKKTRRPFANPFF